MKSNERFCRVIIESPYSGDVARNEIYLQRCIRDCLRRGETPYASHQMLTSALNDLDPAERSLGMRAGRDWYEAAHVCAVYTDYGTSGGMEAGIAHARDIGQRVEFRTIGENPPEGTIEPPIVRSAPGRRSAKNGETKKKVVALRTKGHTQKAIAQMLGCTESNVRHHLYSDAEEQESESMVVGAWR